MTAKLADIEVELKLDTSEFMKGIREAEKTIQKAGREIANSTKEMSKAAGQSFKEFDTNVKGMQKELSRVSGNVDGNFKNINKTLGLTGREVNKVSRQFSDEFSGSLGEIGQKLGWNRKQLKEFRDAVGDNATKSTIFAELMRDKIINAHERMMAKSTQAQDIIARIDGIKLHGISQQFLKLGHSLEERAKQGTALSLAFKRLGDDAPMKDIRKEVDHINKGLGRMTALATGMAYVNVGMLVGLVMLSNHVDGRLIPAFETLKATWADALTPFIKAFTTFALWVMSGAQALGELMKKFAEAHPQLSQMFWGFIALTIALTLLLAPLAVAIGLTGGLSAAFTLLWGSIAPFVLGFLTVVGIAMLVAAAIVVVVAVINNMWEASENFRNAVTTSWAKIKEAIIQALAPIMVKWEELKTKFFELMHTVTGGEAHNMGEFWKWLGDKVAIFVTWFTTVAIPAIKAIVGVFAVVVAGVISFVIWLFTQFQAYWPLISAIVGSTFLLIKNVITSGLAIITNLFNLFKNLLQGNWSAAWENVKNILKNAVVFLWSLAQLWVLGKLLKVVQLAGKGIVAALKGAWNLALSVVRGAVNAILAVGKAVFNSMKVAVIGIMVSLVGGISSRFQAIVDGAKEDFNAVKSKATEIFGKVKKAMEEPIEKAKKTVLKIIEDIKSAFSKMKISIPKPKVPKVKVGKKKDAVFGFDMPTFSIGWNAKGNIFNGASLLGGGQGVGEAGAEVVMPIERKRYMKPYAEMVSELLSKKGSSTESSSGSQYTIQFNEPVVIREDADIQRIVDEMERRKRIADRSKGVFSYLG